MVILSLQDEEFETLAKRIEAICAYVQELDPEQPVDIELLKEAVHDACNVAQMMQAVSRMAKRD